MKPETTNSSDNPLFSILLFVGAVIALWLMPKPKNTDYHISPAERRRYGMLLGRPVELSAFLAEMSLPDIHSPFGERCGSLSNPPAPLSYEYCRGRLGKYLSWKLSNNINT